MFLKSSTKAPALAFLMLASILLFSCQEEGEGEMESAMIAKNSQGETLPLVPQDEKNYCAVAVIAAHLQYWHESNPYTQAQLFWLADFDQDGRWVPHPE